MAELSRMVDSGARDRVSTPEERLQMLRDMKSKGPADAAAAPRTTASAGKASVLGRTLTFKGDLTAEEDLVVQGRVEGSIQHSQSLTIGVDGRMVGDIHARVIVIEGSVEGDLHGTESVSVRSTGRVRGSIFAPSVSLADGAAFNGRIEMETDTPQPAAKPKQQSKQASAPAHSSAPQADKLGDADVDALLRS